MFGTCLTSSFCDNWEAKEYNPQINFITINHSFLEYIGSKDQKSCFGQNMETHLSDTLDHQNEYVALYSLSTSAE